MSDHTYKTVELTGSSTVSSDDAVKNAISRASQTTRNLRWFDIGQVHGRIEGDKVTRWQVTMKVSFTLDEP